MRPLVARRPKGPRADPAPSRLKWRLERWMLTPGIRLALRAGIPFFVALGAGTAYLSDESRRAVIFDKVAEIRASIEERPEFMVNVMSVDGASEDVASDIRDIMPVELPTSSFDIDIEAMRDTIAALDPVKDATVRIRPGGVLEVHVTERIPVMVWRTYDKVHLVDDTGAAISEVETRLVRPDLPLIAGLSANKAVPEALSLMSAARPWGNRLRGLVRMGERRWDVVLDRDQRILLPEFGAEQALMRIIALDKAQDLLARDVAQVDMRLGQRPTVRMNKAATQEWLRIKAQTSAIQAGQ